MSVLLPWDRKRPPAGEQHHVQRSRVSGPPKTRWVLFGSLLLVVATALAFSVRLAPERFETVWRSAGSKLAEASAGRYLIFSSDGFSVWDQSGKLQGAGIPAVDVVLGRNAITFIERGLLTSRELSPAGITSRAWSLLVGEGERLLTHLDDGPILTAMPAEGLKYGESWLMRATGDDGAALWEQRVPGVPLILTSSGSRIAAGIVDVSCGGLPALLSFDRKTGKVAWVKKLEPGLWRGAGFSADGTIVAVLDTRVSAFGPDGSVAWTWDKPTPIVSAAVTPSVTFLSTAGPPGLPGLFSPYLLTALSPSGTLLWTRPLGERPLSLCRWEMKSAQGDNMEAVVALSAAHVIGFSMRDGERLFAKRTGSRPVSLWGDCLLLESGEGLRLVKLGPPGVSGKALTP